MRKSVAKRIRLIKSHRLYSTKELAQEVGVHQRTVQQWQKDGLKPIDCDSKPFLYRGEVAKAFLIDRRRARKHRLQDGEFYCTKCRKPRRSETKDISWEKMGASNRRIIKGRCKECGTSLNRFASKRCFQSGVLGRTVRKADIRLYESQPAYVNTDIGKGTIDE